MKKLTMCILAMVIMFAGASQAHAYMFNDSPNDRIGDRPFELYGMNVTQAGGQLVFDIFSNYSKTGYKVGNWCTKPGDFAFDVNGDSIFEYGVAFTTHTSRVTGGLIEGGIYQINTLLNDPGRIVNGWYISNKYAPPGYGYNPDKIVTIADGTKIGNTNVTWNQGDGTSDYRVNFAIDASALSLTHGGTFDFFYSVATCSNDNMGGRMTVTPEPATMALVGLGLAGLLARRKKS